MRKIIYYVNFFETLTVDMNICDESIDESKFLLDL